jgi:hypothetical protein
MLFFRAPQAELRHLAHATDSAVNKFRSAASRIACAQSVLRATLARVPINFLGTNKSICGAFSYGKYDLNHKQGCRIPSKILSLPKQEKVA